MRLMNFIDASIDQFAVRRKKKLTTFLFKCLWISKDEYFGTLSIHTYDVAKNAQGQGLYTKFPIEQRR